MSCNSEACDVCISGEGGSILLSANPFNRQYLVPDLDVLLYQIDLLTQQVPPLCDVIILQSVLAEVRNKSLVVFNRVSNLLRNESKRFVLFANQNFERTYCLFSLTSLMYSGPLGR